eukprot:6960537-Karenia_brevis.AAC.1
MAISGNKGSQLGVTFHMHLDDGLCGPPEYEETNSAPWLCVYACPAAPCPEHISGAPASHDQQTLQDCACAQ